jgi:glutaconyl-CoA/methylmalonyl-CoA decarboxylase subunit gamma
MAITLFVHGKKLALSNVQRTKNGLTCQVGTQTYQANIISFDPATKLLFFELDNQVYKAKIISNKLGKQELYLFNFNQTITIEPHQEPVFIPSTSTEFTKQATPAFQPTLHTTTSSVLKSPLAGRVIKVLVTVGQEVKALQPLVIIESMKMENEICAPHNTIIKTLSIAAGNLVQQNQVLVTFDEMKGEIDGTSKNEHGQATI